MLVNHLSIGNAYIGHTTIDARQATPPFNHTISGLVHQAFGILRKEARKTEQSSSYFAYPMQNALHEVLVRLESNISSSGPSKSLKAELGTIEKEIQAGHKKIDRSYKKSLVKNTTIGVALIALSVFDVILTLLGGANAPQSQVVNPFEPLIMGFSYLPLPIKGCGLNALREEIQAKHRTLTELRKAIDSIEILLKVANKEERQDFELFLNLLGKDISFTTQEMQSLSSIQIEKIVTLFEQARYVRDRHGISFDQLIAMENMEEVISTNLSEPLAINLQSFYKTYAIVLYQRSSFLERQYDQVSGQRKDSSQSNEIEMVDFKEIRKTRIELTQLRNLNAQATKLFNINIKRQPMSENE